MRQESKAKGVGKKDSFVEIHNLFATNLSNVYSWAVKEEEDAVEVRFKCRSPGDWIAIAKRVGHDGTPEVLFATAFDFVSCVLAVNGAMSGDRWKPDRPFTPAEG